MTTWFEDLTGFAELPYAETQAKLEAAGATLRSHVNGRSYAIGTLETPALSELRARAEPVADRVAGRLRVSSVVADVGQLHRDDVNGGALFQVASQFNLLEMTGPDVGPEDGVTRYLHDPTQGPACAIAAGAATIYRNYLVPLDGQVGQTRARQIDCLNDVGTALGNDNRELWTMRNGYALCTASGLASIGRTLNGLTDAGRAAIRDRLRIGLHWDVEVAAADARGHLVSQAFCSALPVSYTPVPPATWQSFATLVLEGAYEATLWAGLLNAHRGVSPVVYLTLLGGGAFGNEREWIVAAMRRALRTCARAALDVRLVGQRPPGPDVAALVKEFA